MDIKLKDVENYLNKIEAYLKEHKEEWSFGEKVIPVMIRTLKSFESELNNIEKKYSVNSQCVFSSKRKVSYNEIIVIYTLNFYLNKNTVLGHVLCIKD